MASASASLSTMSAGALRLGIRFCVGVVTESGMSMSYDLVGRVGGVDSAAALKSRSAQDLDTSSVPCSCLAIGCSLLQKIDNQVHIFPFVRDEHEKYEVPLDSSNLSSGPALQLFGSRPGH